MTREETIKVVAVLSISYKPYFEKFSKDELDMYINTFHACLNEYDFKDVQIATMNHIKTNKYAYPNIAEINSLLAPKIKIDCEKMWSIAMKNCRADMKYAKANYENLDESIKPYFTPELLNEIGWARNDEISYIKQRVFKEWQTKAQNVNDKALIGNNNVRLLK